MGEPNDFSPCRACGVIRRDHDPATFEDWSGPISDHMLEGLLVRYGPQEVPPCRVCGAGLTPSSMGGGRPTIWRCGSPEADWLGVGYDSPEKKHWDLSTWEQQNHGDPAVHRALVELRDRRGMGAETFGYAIVDVAAPVVVMRGRVYSTLDQARMHMPTYQASYSVAAVHLVPAPEGAT